MKIKEAKEIQINEYILIPQHSRGVLVAKRVIKVEFTDHSSFIEIVTDDNISHLIKLEEKIVVFPA